MPKKRAVAKKKAPKLSRHVDSSDILDDIDKFHKKPSTTSQRKRRDEGDQRSVMEVDYHYDDKLANLPYHEDEEEEEEQPSDNFSGAQPLSVSDDEELAQSSDDDAEYALQSWGKKPRDYYQAHEDDISEAEDAEMEEQEASRQQKERAKALRDEDFLGDDDGLEDDEETGFSRDDLLEDDDDLVKAKLAKASRDLDDVSFSDPFGSQDVSVVKMKRDMSKLSVKEKMAIIEAEAPELLSLLAELKTRLQELKDNVQPMILKVKSKQIPTHKGVSFLEVKFSLLISYCLNLCFYFLLKAEGKSVKDHPVISHLVKIRLMLEKIRPIDSKLHYQLDKLFKMASSESFSSDIADHSSSTSASNANPLLFKPSLADMQHQLEDDLEDDEKPGVYKVSKDSSVFYDDPSSKRERTLAKKKDAARRSSIFDTIRSQLSEAPEEQSMGIEVEAGTRSKVDEERQGQMRQFEEKMFVRLRETAKEQKRRVENRFTTNPFNIDFDEYRDIAAFGSNTTADNSVSRILREATKSTDQDDDQDQHPAPDLDMDDDESEDEFYKQALESSSKRDKVKKMIDAEGSKATYFEDTIEEGERRPTNYTIEKNKGLTPYRKKEYRNPRKHLRNKFEKATKKRKSVVRTVTQPKGHYEGEKTGIRTTTIRRTKLS